MNIKHKNHSYYKAAVDSNNNFAGFVKMNILHKQDDKDIEKKLDSRIRELKYHPYGRIAKMMTGEDENV